MDESMQVISFFPLCYSLKVCIPFQIHMLKPNNQYDGGALGGD
jgi:hypothetical protein